MPTLGRDDQQHAGARDRDIAVVRNAMPPQQGRWAFLCGSLRAGTTLLRLMIKQNPSIRELGEIDYITDHIEDRGGIPTATSDVSRRVKSALQTNRVFNNHDLELDDTLPLATMLRDHLNTRKGGTELALGTVHRHFTCLHDLYPEALFIHLLRDPRDVAPSSVQMGFAGNLYRGVDCWLDAEESWDRLKTRLRPGQAIEVRYEELVSEPERIAQVISQFLGIAYTPAMVDLAHTTYSSPQKQHAGKWSGRLSKHEIYQIEARVGHLIKDRGYIPYYDETPHLSKIQTMHLQFDSKVRKMLFSIRRYGPSLFLLETLTRRTGPYQIWARLRHQMNDIEKRFLK